jgi:hypothetical protein
MLPPMATLIERAKQAGHRQAPCRAFAHRFLPNPNQGQHLLVRPSKVVVRASAGIRAVAIRPEIQRHQLTPAAVTTELVRAMKYLVVGSRDTSARR